MGYKVKTNTTEVEEELKKRMEEFGLVFTLPEEEEEKEEKK